MRILLFNFARIPSNHIGARRWMKFTQELLNLGHEVHLVSTDYGQDEIKNIDLNFSTTNYLKNNYPIALTEIPQNLIQKLKYKKGLKKVKSKTAANYYDRGIFVTNELRFLLTEMLKTTKFDLVIASGGPFSCVYTISECLSEESHQHIKLLVDFRDPWTWGENFGIKSIEPARREIEEKREHAVCQRADVITVPMPKMAEDIIRFYPESEGKVHTLFHGYSNLEFEGITTDYSGENNLHNLKFIYGGTIYDELKEQFESIFNWINSEKSITQLSIYAREPEKLSWVEGDKINVKSTLSTNSFFSKLNDFDWFLWVFPERYRDYLSTKLFEIVRLRLPILYFGYPGDFSRFIEENRLGVFFNISEQQRIEPNYLVSELIKLDYNYSFEIERFSTRKLIIELLDKI